MPSYLHKQVSGIATKNNKLESQPDARLRGHDGVLLRVFTELQPLMHVFLCDSDAWAPEDFWYLY